MVVTYSPYDPIGVPSLLVTVLHVFDGRPTAVILDGLRQERGLALDGALLQELLDWGLLQDVPAD